LDTTKWRRIVQYVLSVGIMKTACTGGPRIDVGLTIIRLPEHPLSREEYNPVFCDRYREMIAEELPEAEIANLWEVAGDQFFDQIHLTYPGTKWMTDQIAPGLARSAQSGR